MTQSKALLNNAALSGLLFFSVFISLSLFLSERYVFGSLYFLCALSFVKVFIDSQDNAVFDRRLVCIACVSLWLCIIGTLLTAVDTEESLLLYGIFPLSFATLVLLGLKLGTILSLGTLLICLPMLIGKHGGALVYQSLSFVLYLILFAVLLRYSRGLERSLERAKTTDPLTGCCSISHFKKQFEMTTELNRRYKSDATCLGLQLKDNIQSYQQLEKRLLEVAQICQSRIRLTDCVCCYDNQNILILLPNTDLDSAHNLGRDLIQACEAYRFSYLAENETTSSGFGYQLFSYTDSDSWEHWFSQVTQSLSLR